MIGLGPLSIDKTLADKYSVCQYICYPIMDSLQVYAALPPTRGEVLIVLKRITTRSLKTADGSNNTTLNAWLSALDKQLGADNPEAEIVLSESTGDKGM